MKTDAEIEAAVRAMAVEAGAAWAHLQAVERALTNALGQISDEEAMQIDPSSEAGMFFDRLRLSLRRAVLPIAEACGALAEGIPPPVRVADVERKEVRLDLGKLQRASDNCGCCGAPMLRFERGSL